MYIFALSLCPPLEFVNGVQLEIHHAEKYVNII